MSNEVSKLESIRINGKTQVEAQRASILDAAEALFLQKGLENTSMTDIAAAAGVTRMTLYRYFPDRHPIAFEVAARMLRKIAAAADLGDRPVSPELLRELALAMIDQFYALRGAYRYLGMFDHLYGDHYPSEALAVWYKEQIFGLAWGGRTRLLPEAGPQRSQMVMLVNTIMSFLQKLAARGDLMAAEQEAPLDEQLAAFRQLMIVYFDHLLGG